MPQPDSSHSTPDPWLTGDGFSASAKDAATAQFIINHEGIILAAREEHSFRINMDDVVGEDLRSLLCLYQPGWQKHLPSNLFSNENILHLPSCKAGGDCYTVHRIRCGSQMTVTLVPDIPPVAELKHYGLADFSASPTTFARLFLRLRSSEERLTNLLNLIPGVVFHQRVDGSFSSTGPGVQNLLGIPPQALHKDSQALIRLIHESDEPEYRRTIARHHKPGQTFSQVYRIYNQRTQSYLHVLDIRCPQYTPGGLLLGYEGIWLDITRQRLAEHRLATQNWSEGISTITTGLLADFNNVMTGIHSLSELYHGTLADDHPLREGLGLIRANSAQARQLVSQIIDLNQPPRGDKTYVQIGRFIRQQIPLLKLILPPGSMINGPTDDGPWITYVDEMGLRQMLIQLTLNTRDACQQMADIKISIRSVGPGHESHPGTIPELPPAQIPSLEMVFSDDGCGIPDEHLPLVFNPFFTTRDTTRSSGLGLYHVKLFVEDHGGRIAARSVPGHGTSIVIQLPLSEGHTPPPPLRSASGRLLYLEPGMTEESFLMEYLAEESWQIRSVATCEHALRLLDEQSGQFDVLFIHHSADADPLSDFIETVHRKHPEIPLVLQVKSSRTPPLDSRVDLCLPPTMPREDVLSALNKLLRSST